MIEVRISPITWAVPLSHFFIIRIIHKYGRRASNLTRKVFKYFAPIRATKKASRDALFYTRGWGEIRTHGPVSRATVFKTVSLDHSDTHPSSRGQFLQVIIIT